MPTGKGSLGCLVENGQDNCRSEASAALQRTPTSNIASSSQVSCISAATITGDVFLSVGCQIQMLKMYFGVFWGFFF